MSCSAQVTDYWSEDFNQGEKKSKSEKAGVETQGEEDVPEHWDDEYRSGRRRYNREALLYYRKSTFCLTRPTFMVEAACILERPHGIIDPLDPSKTITLHLSHRLTNRGNAQYVRRNDEQKKFDQWWAEKQEQDKENNDPSELKQDVEHKVTGSQLEGGSNEDVIKSCVESVLKDVDIEDDANAFTNVTQDGRRTQEIADVDDRLSFDPIKSVRTGNLSIDMAIINRARMSPIMRVSSSRPTRLPFPSLPQHSSVELWGNFNVQELAAQRSVPGEQLPSLQRGQPFGSRNRSPMGVNLISVSKDLIIDSEKEQNSLQGFPLSFDIESVDQKIETSCDDNVDNRNVRFGLSSVVTKMRGDLALVTDLLNQTSTNVGEAQSGENLEQVEGADSALDSKDCQECVNVNSVIKEDAELEEISNDGDLFANLTGTMNMLSLKDSDILTSVSSKDSELLTSVSSKDSEHLTSVSLKDSELLTSVSSKYNELLTSVSLKGSELLTSEANVSLQRDGAESSLVQKHNRNLIEEFDKIDESQERNTAVPVVETFSINNSSSDEFVDTALKCSIEESTDPTMLIDVNSNVCDFDNLNSVKDDFLTTSSSVVEEKLSNDSEDIFFECEDTFGMEPVSSKNDVTQTDCVESQDVIANDAPVETGNEMLSDFGIENVILGESISLPKPEAAQCPMTSADYTVDQNLENFPPLKSRSEPIYVDDLNPVASSELEGKTLKNDDIESEKLETDISSAVSLTKPLLSNHIHSRNSNVGSKVDTLDEFDDDLCMQAFKAKDSKGSTKKKIKQNTAASAPLPAVSSACTQAIPPIVHDDIKINQETTNTQSVSPKEKQNALPKAKPLSAQTKTVNSMPSGKESNMKEKNKSNQKTKNVSPNNTESLKSEAKSPQKVPPLAVAEPAVRKKSKPSEEMKQIQKIADLNKQKSTSNKNVPSDSARKKEGMEHLSAKQQIASSVKANLKKKKMEANQNKGAAPTTNINVKNAASVFVVDNSKDVEAADNYDENESHEEWQCQESKKTRRKRTISNNNQVPDVISEAEKVANCNGYSTFLTSDPQLRKTPKERAVSNEASAPVKSFSSINSSQTSVTDGTWNTAGVIDYCCHNNVMYILRGIPGSGKSTIAHTIKRLYPDNTAYICSADDFSVNYHGQYQFQASKLEQNHGLCQERARSECLSGRNVIIVDNTNIKRSEFEFYLRVAHQNDYIVHLIEVGEMDVDKCAGRNKHKVPKDKIAVMKSNYEEVIAYYYGWWLSISDTFELRFTVCAMIMPFINGIVAFKNFAYRRNFQNIDNLFHVYNMKSSSSSKNLLHITACYTSSGHRPGSRRYSFSKPVIGALGKVHNIQVIGLCLTERSLFARVLLTENQKLVWGNNDAYNGEINRLYKDCGMDKESSSDVESNTSEEDYNAFSPNKLNNCVAKMSRFLENMPEGFLMPDYGLGCTAHITLGIIDGCVPVHSKDDLKSIITAELDERPNLEYNFTKELVRMYRDNLWVVYFKESLIIPAMFSGTYYSERAPIIS